MAGQHDAAAGPTAAGCSSWWPGCVPSGSFSSPSGRSRLSMRKRDRVAGGPLADPGAGDRRSLPASRRPSMASSTTYSSLVSCTVSPSLAADQPRRLLVAGLGELADQLEAVGTLGYWRWGGRPWRWPPRPRGRCGQPPQRWWPSDGQPAPRPAAAWRSRRGCRGPSPRSRSRGRRSGTDHGASTGAGSIGAGWSPRTGVAMTVVVRSTESATAPSDRQVGLVDDRVLVGVGERRAVELLDDDRVLRRGGDRLGAAGQDVGRHGRVDRCGRRWR